MKVAIGEQRLFFKVTVNTIHFPIFNFIFETSKNINVHRRINLPVDNTVVGKQAT